jgi:hypothetical protein
MLKKFSKSFIINIYKRVSKYISGFITFLKPRLNSGIKYVKKNKQAFIIGFTAIPVAVIWGLLFFRWINTPRPAIIGKTGNGNAYYFQGSSNNYTVKIGDKKTNEPKVEFSMANNKSVTFYPASASSKIPTPVEKNNTVTFKNVYPNTDYIYRAIPLGIKEDIVIHKPNGISIYPFYLETKGVTPKYYTTNIAGGVFYDEKGKYIFNFEKPFAVDAKGARNDNVNITIKKDASSGKLVAILGVDENWLKDNARVYPVTIDPTVIFDTSTKFAAGQLNRVTDTGSGSSPNLTSYYQELPADINTVGLWHFDETSGNAFDSSGNANHGTVAGTTITTGIIGNARTTAASGNYITVNNNANLTFTSQDFTIEAWIYPTDVSGTMYLLSKGVYQTDGYYILVSNAGDGKVYLTTQQGSAAQNSSSYAITANNWYHIAAVRQGSSARIYINGIDATTTSGTIINPVTNTRPLIIGADQTGANGFIGKVDELRISNIARTPEEIKLDAQLRPYSIYTSNVLDLSKAQSWNSLSWSELGVNTGNGETPYSTTGLVAQWNFNSASGTTASNDAGGSSCGGTAANCDGALIPFFATGGTIATSSGYTTHTFTNTGSVTFKASLARNVEVLVVGGGGGGGGAGSTWACGGGGGGGGVVYNASLAITASPITVTVGVGGTAGTAYNAGTNGGDSSLVSLVTATGGGRGGAYSASQTASTGGSGGGGGGYTTGTNYLGQAGTPGQGNAGGNGISGFNPDAGGGGGGAGSIGTAASGSTAGHGGDGTLVFGSYYGGGGGGGSITAGGVGPGGSGVGGNGTFKAVGSVGTANTGGGGGGAGWDNSAGSAAGGNGGSGIVIIRYPTPASPWTSDNRRWGSGALMFDGTNYVNVPDNNALDLTGDMTLEGWFNFTINNATQNLIQKDSNNGYSMYLSSTGELCLFIGGGSSYCGNKVVNIGQWHYLSISKSGTTASIYIDGILDTSLTVLGTIPTNAQALGIGAKATDASGPMNGTIDSVRIYSRALPASEVLSNYQAGNIELQTRVGNTADPNDGTWESWKPTTGETVIDNMDNPQDWATPFRKIRQRRWCRLVWRCCLR